MSPIAPVPITITVSFSSISAYSAAVKPVVMTSTHISAASGLSPSGILARFISARGTLKSSAKRPSMFLPSFPPEKGKPSCPVPPGMSGITAGTATSSPFLKSLTSLPVSTTSASPSCPNIIFSLLGFDPPNTVCTSEEQGLT